MPSFSYLFTVRFRTSSQSRVIIYERRIFNYSEQGHSIYTRKRRARERNALTDACALDELT
jgi:hypothetical protein